MTHSALQERIESVLSRYRGRLERPSQQEIDDLYTDACAAVLSLEAERLSLKRRLMATKAESASDNGGASDAPEFERLSQISDELDALRRLVRLLRTAVDWTHSATSEPSSADEPERFRRGGSG